MVDYTLYLPPMLNLFSTRVPVYYVILGVILSAFLSYTLLHSRPVALPGSAGPSASANLNGSVCSYNLPRLAGYHFVHPLMFAEPNCESEKYAPLKERIQQEIESLRGEGVITDASVYVCDFDEEAWISINEQEKFSPGSLLKVPVLITYLRMSEETPRLLDQRLIAPGHDNSLPVPEYKSKSIVPGQGYTIRELLRYMIAYSDNDATNLLMSRLTDAEYLKTFTDFGLPAPEKGKVYPVSAKAFSVYMNVLYDGGYLTFANSDYAISLLSQSEFTEGIVKGVPETVKVAHKYGEWGEGDSRELHETAIIYMNRSPYLLTIMTRGHDTQKLSEALSSISKITYDDMERNN